MKTNRLLLELMALVSILPILRENLHTVFFLVLFVLWFLNSVYQSSFSYVIKDPWGVSKWWLILIFYELFLSIIGFSSTIPNNFIMRIPVYSIPMIMTFVLRKYSYKDQRHLFVFIVSIIVVTILQNTFLYLRNPSLYGEFMRADSTYKLSNFGTSSFVGCVLFMVPSCFLLNQKKMPGIPRLLVLLGLILPFIYITFINERATSFVLLLYFIVALLYVRKVHINNTALYVVLTIFVFAIGLMLVVPLLDWLASVLNSEKLVVRINSISQSIQNSEIDEQSEGSLYARFFLMQVSLKTWMQSVFTFLFGIGEDALPLGSLGFVSDLEVLGIGQHSQIIDFLAMYGIVGTALLLKAFHSTFSCIRSFAVDKTMTREMNIVFLGYVLMNILNNTIYADELFVMFILFGISVNLFSQKSFESN